MSEDGKLHVVIGAGGGIGSAVIRALDARGLTVRGVSRSGQADVPERVELQAADALNEEDIVAVCEGAAVVYHCANLPYPEWEKSFPRLTDNIIEAAAKAKATLVFADNLYMYGPVMEPLHEELPSSAQGVKGRVRAGMARDVLQAHRAGKVRAVIGRASDFYGPGVTNAAMGDRVFGAALRSETIDLLGDIDSPHTYTFIDDFAQSLITLGEREEALGQVWHTPNATAISTRQFVQKVIEITKTDPKVRVAPKALLKAMGLFNPMLRELQEILYQFDGPFLVDDSKFSKAFGKDVTRFDAGIPQTVAWYQTHANLTRVSR